MAPDHDASIADGTAGDAHAGRDLDTDSRASAAERGADEVAAGVTIEQRQHGHVSASNAAAPRTSAVGMSSGDSSARRAANSVTDDERRIAAAASGTLGAATIVEIGGKPERHGTGDDAGKDAAHAAVDCRHAGLRVVQHEIRLAHGRTKHATENSTEGGPGQGNDRHEDREVEQRRMAEHDVDEHQDGREEQAERAPIRQRDRQCKPVARRGDRFARSAGAGYGHAGDDA